MSKQDDDIDYEAIAATLIAKAEANERRDPPEPAPDPSAEQKARRIRALGAAGWGRRTLRVADESYDESRSSAYLDALRSGDGGRDGRILVLAGQPGSGKTAACARWALTRPSPAASGRFATPRFLTAAAFFRASRYERKDDGDDRLTRDQILGFETLVLDDLGVEFADGSGNYRVDIDELANRFYEDDRTLIVTTNLLYASTKARDALKARGAIVDETAQTFADRYGERIVDRVRECGRWVDSSAPSMRRRSA